MAARLELFQELLKQFPYFPRGERIWPATIGKACPGILCRQFHFGDRNCSNCFTTLIHALSRDTVTLAFTKHYEHAGDEKNYERAR